MTVTELTYFVTSQSIMTFSLAQIELSKCHNVTSTIIARSNNSSPTHLDYFEISATSSGWYEASLYTIDVDQLLRGNTIDFTWLINVSDGTTNLALATFTVEFIGDNNLPYFEPPLTSYL